MKKIANFGEWVIDMWFPVLIFFAVVIWGIVDHYAPKTVALDAKHWECTMAVPDGIGSRCIEYIAKGK